MMLLGLAEIADLLGVTKQVVANWRTRKSNFPSPIANLKSGPVWESSAIESWATSEGISINQPDAMDRAKGEIQRQPATVVAMMNMKGGVGKSTLTANLAWYAAMRRDLRILLIDLDPQFNLSQYILGVAGYERLLDGNRPTIEAFFRAADSKPNPIELKDIVHRVVDWDDGSCLHLIPASLELAWSMKHTIERPQLLKDGISELRDEYDIILIDCSPTESILTSATYYASDYIFVPVRPEFLSTIGLPLLLRSMEEFRKNHRNVPTPEIGGIIFNDTSEKIEHDRSRAYVRGIAAEYNLNVFANEVSHSDSYPAGARLGKPIFMTDNARGWKVNEFSRVAAEFLGSLGR